MVRGEERRRVRNFSPRRVIRFDLPVASVEVPEAEGESKHRNEKAVGADDCDRENGPYENRENEKCEEFLRTADGRNSWIRKIGASRNHGHLPIIDYSAGRYNLD